MNIIRILLSQKRYEDCGDTVAVTRLETHIVKDRFFSRQLKEIEFLVSVQSGDLKEAVSLAEEIIDHAEKNHQVDESLIMFMGDYSELLYDMEKSKKSVEIIAKASKIAWNRLHSYGLTVDALNIN